MSATAPRCSRCSGSGVEVWPVHTVHFSNHTGYGEWRGPLLPADDVRAVIQGVEERGAFPEVAQCCPATRAARTSAA
jgi:pyridoxal/pyridoxine/pyridoxamine kinase